MKILTFIILIILFSIIYIGNPIKFLIDSKKDRNRYKNRLNDDWGNDNWLD
jgi:hypothetical protein